MSYSPQSMSVRNLMREIYDYYLPAIQREFVWPSGKIEALFDSLLRGYPIGTLLLWDVREPQIHEFTFYNLVRNFDVRNTHNEVMNLANKKSCKGILDGQQRINSLLIGFLGSYTEKLKYKRSNSPAAFPNKKLYINLLFQPKPDSHQRFQIKFLTDRQSASSDNAYWFPFGKILELDTVEKLFKFRKSTLFGDNLTFEETLGKLFSVVHSELTISYFMCTEENLDEVLNIFVRLNTGGTPLSYSDLLLSLATAAWRRHDARESVYRLVVQLNEEYGSRFCFSKDLVLKTLLVASDKDIRFKTDNIRKRSQLEEIWEGVQESLEIAVRLVAGFGFNGETLTAPYAVIPIAYYIYKRKDGEGFLTHSQYAQEREDMRIWLLKMLLGRAFRGQTDSLLASIREEIRKSLLSPTEARVFPADAINTQLRASRNFVFTEDNITQLIDETQYGSPYAFAILALIYPHLKYEYSNFHIDHMHPRRTFTKEGLGRAGVPRGDVAFCLEHFNQLPNLQLLSGPVNESKRQQPFEKWLEGEQNPGYTGTRALFLMSIYRLGTSRSST